ncbi:MAG: glycoside hydrolase family 3 [Spirochaetes bacterium]|nr:glycoside hydrolase family 3 [Spirochaetota bacterium]
MKVKKIAVLIILLFIVSFFIHSAAKIKKKGKTEDEYLKEMIGQMIITTFDGDSLDSSAMLKIFIDDLKVGGLILSNSNVVSKEQLKDFLLEIKMSNQHVPLFFCVDEEGEYVRRLKARHGFRVFDFSPFDLGEIDDLKFTKKVYEELANELKEVGLNFNFAPCVDVDTNFNNPVISKLKRSYSSDPDIVVKHAEIFINLQEKLGILSCLKHFPGHGSSTVDSHKGFTNVTETYLELELEPFLKLKNKTASVMIGHLFNENWDNQYPATLSKKVVTGMLMNDLGYKGLIITDDINMAALTNNYELEEIVLKSIEAGNDLIICSKFINTQKITEIIYGYVKDGTLTQERIEESVKKILKYKNKYKLEQNKKKEIREYERQLKK